MRTCRSAAAFRYSHRGALTLAETWSAPEAGFDKPREFAGALHRAITAANDTELLFAIWEQNAETVRALNDPRSKMLY